MTFYRIEEVLIIERESVCVWEREKDKETESEKGIEGEGRETED